ncbi:MAG: phage holin family protein [Steroidobacteraceae bacterium]
MYQPGADEEEEHRAPGIVDSLRSTVATFLQILHTRVELFTTELEEEMHRVAAVLLWGAVAVFFGGLFVLMVALTIIIAAGPDNYLLASIVMTGVFLAILITAVVMLKTRMSQRIRLLSSSLEELKRDRDSLRRSAQVVDR